MKMTVRDNAPGFGRHYVFDVAESDMVKIRFDKKDRELFEKYHNTRRISDQLSLLRMIALKLESSGIITEI